jgi:hypothetical protein
VTGTIKKNIQTTTIYISLCEVGSYRFENILIYDLTQIVMPVASQGTSKEHLSVRGSKENTFFKFVCIKNVLEIIIQDDFRPRPIYYWGLQSNVGPVIAYGFFCSNRAKTRQLRGSYAMA